MKSKKNSSIIWLVFYYNDISGEIKPRPSVYEGEEGLVECFYYYQQLRLQKEFERLINKKIARIVRLQRSDGIGGYYSCVVTPREAFAHWKITEKLGVSLQYFDPDKLKENKELYKELRELVKEGKLEPGEVRGICYFHFYKPGELEKPPIICKGEKEVVKFLCSKIPEGLKQEEFSQFRAYTRFNGLTDELPRYMFDNFWVQANKKLAEEKSNVSLDKD